MMGAAIGLVLGVWIGRAHDPGGALLLGACGALVWGACRWRRGQAERYSLHHQAAQLAREEPAP